MTVTEYLQLTYERQCEFDPSLPGKISWATYLKANRRHVSTDALENIDPRTARPYVR